MPTCQRGGKGESIPISQTGNGAEGDVGGPSPREGAIPILGSWGRSPSRRRGDVGPIVTGGDRGAGPGRLAAEGSRTYP